MFLGQKGAGVRFIEIFQRFSDYNAHNITFLISAKAKNQLPTSYSGTFTTLSIPNWRFLPLLPIVLLHQLWTLAIMTKLRRKNFLFVMPSPSDFFLLFLLRIFRFPTSFILHDAITHSGEKWPTSRSIKFRIRISRKLFTLSEFSQNEVLEKYGTNSLRLSHPSFLTGSNAKLSDDFNSLDNYFLYVGRIRDYKGVLDLINAYNSRSRSALLVIAGEGKLLIKPQDKIIVINRWLSDAEFEYLIGRARAVVFPYKDASQSGIIPICVSLGVPIIVSDAGALKEQASMGELLGVFPIGDTEGLAELLTKVESGYLRPKVSMRVDYERTVEFSNASCRRFVNDVVNHLNNDNKHF